MRPCLRLKVLGEEYHMIKASVSDAGCASEYVPQMQYPTLLKKRK